MMVATLVFFSIMVAKPTRDPSLALVNFAGVACFK